MDLKYQREVLSHKVSSPLHLKVESGDLEYLVKNTKFEEDEIKEWYR